jgi:hypothetical protein
MDSGSSKYICSKCHIEKDPHGFYPSQLGKVCKDCFNMYPSQCRKRGYETEVDGESSSSVSESLEASLYIFCNPLIPGMVKIGRASCPVARAQSMSQSHPFHLTVFQTYYQMGFLESTVHRRLSDRRVASGPGREWFHASPDEADIIVRASLLEHKWSQAVSQA